VKGRSSGGQQWRVAGGGADSAGVGLGRVRGWAEEVEGEVERLWARGIGLGQRELVGTAPAAGSARLGSA
jgi:hypothetical protein